MLSIIKSKANRNVRINPLPSWHKLGSDIDGEAPNDRSGVSVALSSDGLGLAVGANLNDGLAGNNSGHVRVYRYNGFIWRQLGADIDGEFSNDNSGINVSLSSDGRIVAIGANAHGNISGHVRIYRYDSSKWTQLGNDIDGEAEGNNSGFRVSLSSNGTMVAIGSPTNDSLRGHVRVYSYNGSDWTKIGNTIVGAEEGDQSGTGLSLSGIGNTVAIGSPRNDTSGNNAGQVRIYRYTETAWTQVSNDINGENTEDQSGVSVSLSSDGTIVAIGADRSGNNAGHVRVYRYDGSVWTQLGGDIDGEADGDQSGFRVALSSGGNIVAIGGPGNSSSKGHVRIYKFENSNWVQIGKDIDGEMAGDQSGHSVSLSSNGTIIAIGANLHP